jgi:metal-responsive CopG/Arc/MetJ family transcriptional regulator
MSKGTQVYSVRINDALMQLVDEQIDSRNAWSPRTPWTRSDFIMTALREKLAKMKRCRNKRGSRRRLATSMSL